MNIIKHPKMWIFIALLTTLLTFMLIIIKHYDADNDLQQRIDNHSEIKDTIWVGKKGFPQKKLPGLPESFSTQKE